MNLSRVLKAIRPSDEEREMELAFCELLVHHISESSPRSCEVVLTGSMAKRTFLRDKRDVDVFVLFDRSVPKEELEAYVKDIMDSAFPSLGYQLSYAEHPYVRFHFEGRRIDLVPAYKISDASERLSSVDRSVLHTEYVLRRLKGAQADSVLLLKQLLKANGIYGAEIKTAGFSGYLCELLIIRYGSFGKLIREAAKWKRGVFIDLGKHHRSPEQIAEARGRFGDFTVVDPTDGNRNVAAAVSRENLAKFVSLCKRFLRKPSEGLFFREPPDFEELVERAARGRRCLILSMPRPDVVDDILWGQLYKMMGQLSAHLREFGPRKMLADDSWHVVRIAIPLERDTLPGKMLVEGPPLDMEKNVAQFRRSHKGARFLRKKKRIWAEEKRPLTTAKQSIAGFFRSFEKTRSNLAYPGEMVVIERYEKGRFTRA